MAASSSLSLKYLEYYYYGCRTDWYLQLNYIYLPVYMNKDIYIFVKTFIQQISLTRTEPLQYKIYIHRII